MTELAREWFWVKKKPWSTVERLLLACLSGTDEPRVELVKLAREIVCGTKKLVGRTDDGTYAMVDDDQDLLAVYQAQWSDALNASEAARAEMEQKFYQLTDYLIDSGYGHLLQISGSSEDEGGSNMSAALNSYLEQARLEAQGFDDSYGWLAPDGTFYPVDWGEHQGWAYQKAQQMRWLEHSSLRTGREGDILVQHGWVLLHSPGMGIADVTASDLKPLTKAQREFLFNYYADRGKPELASKYFMDE